MFDSGTRSSCRVPKELVVAETAGIVREGDGVPGAGLGVLHEVGVEAEDGDAGFHGVEVICATAPYMGVMGAGGFDAGSLGNSVVVSGAMLNCAEVGSYLRKRTPWSRCWSC